MGFMTFGGTRTKGIDRHPHSLLSVFCLLLSYVLYCTKVRPSPAGQVSLGLELLGGHLLLHFLWSCTTIVGTTLFK